MKPDYPKDEISKSLKQCCMGIRNGTNHTSYQGDSLMW